MRQTIVLGLLLISTALSAQKSWAEVLDQLSIASEEYLNAYITKNWDTYINMTYPNIIEMAGDKTLVIQNAEENIEMYESLGFRIEGINIGDKIESADSSEGIQAIIPAAIIMIEGDQALEVPITLFAISADIGDSWKFVELTQYTPEIIKQFIPEFSDELLKTWASQ
jgi:hypothetical protein